MHPYLGYALVAVATAAAAHAVLGRCARYELKGRHVVVTGGSSGIGKEVARQALRSGAAAVTLVARKVSVLAEAKAELEKTAVAGQAVLIASIDVGAGEEPVVEAFERLVKAAGMPVDVLVNCAGTSTPGMFEDLDPGTFDHLMRVNYLGSVYPSRAVVPTMKSRGGGRIVFVSSQAGQVGVFGFSAYSPTKFALVGLAQVLRMELAPYGVSVSVAFPPDTDTPGFAEENAHKPEETRLISETAGLFKPAQVTKCLRAGMCAAKCASAAHTSLTIDAAAMLHFKKCQVADHIIQGLKTGTFVIYSGLDGWMLANLTAGMAPLPNSFPDAVTQCLLSSLLRFISLFYVAQFDGIAAAGKCKRDRSKKSA